MVTTGVYDEFTINLGKPICCIHVADIKDATTFVIGAFAVA